MRIFKEGEDQGYPYRMFRGFRKEGPNFLVFILPSFQIVEKADVQTFGLGAKRHFAKFQPTEMGQVIYSDILSGKV
nr:hypothetical protein [Thermus tengchongensis]